MSKNLVIVESPAKAKTIEKYLGHDFHVLSSVGHIRKDTKVDIKNNFSVTYEIDPGHTKVVRELKKAVKEADTVWLATDEDREGESISWHLLQVLNLPESTHRITFHEITKPALEEAIKHPRTVDMAMVQSQQARQTLDMLVGFDLSGVVRRKVPGAISAGRVQSPALRLIVEKEREIEHTKEKFSFKVTGTFKGDRGHDFLATLDKHSPETEETAKNLLDTLNGARFTVDKIDKSEALKPNPVPFATAALQIEANSRLGFSSSTTMRAAQGLYQAGHITYHRTDSLNLSKQAIVAMAAYIESTYGKQYLHVRHFKTKSAGAQEAHEAIRPTHIEVDVAGANDYERKLYKLIRARTLATQMANAKVAKTTVTLKPDKAPDKLFKAQGEIVIFDGFLKVYGKQKDLELPTLAKGDIVNALKITARQTFAKPPARYTEGSLVKKLEELGIGRPSTYASIMTAIQSRGYVKKGESEGKNRKVIELVLENNVVKNTTVEEKSGATKGKLLPTPIGELVSDFLTDHFDQIVDYGFTADVETKLDKIAEQKLDRVKMLRDFYTPFSELVDHSSFIDRYNSATELGQDPATGKPIFAKIGKNGGFIQLGLNEKDCGQKPRFVPLPKGKTVKTVTLEDALKQLALPTLPRSLGTTKDGTELIAASGPFGPYLKAGKYNIPLKGKDPYTIAFADAQVLYDAKLKSIIKDFGNGIMIVNGAYGPYIKGCGRRNNVKIPKDTDAKKITKKQAEDMLLKKFGTKALPGATALKKASKKTKKSTSKKKQTAKK
ncbi:MAG: type I DNA topoisomerase [Bacteroidaceae bacterium]|nr:type I DNA topoisomerase [Bacteroidaceae bacterium]MBR3595284.1 type I DNA topoisomerase [Candidatus Saccharibacteria bacterium]MBR6122162.1 type I DNA topoisomerase [Candidatus Saccharibacteria bacterium]